MSVRLVGSALMETPIPNRITSDAYIHGLLMPLSKVHSDVASRSFYVENPKPYIGETKFCSNF